jgi:uncharacterized protein
VDRIQLGVLVLVSLPLTALVLMVVLHYYLVWRYLKNIERIFLETPLFVVPRGQPVADAEDVAFATEGGLKLRGCYLKGRGPRRGVILFGGEYGSNRWACLQYCDHLLAAGYDVFAYEGRSSGDSDPDPAYQPLQWLTEHDRADAKAALKYLQGRPDADPRGVGLLGVSKGAGAGLLAAVGDPHVRCAVTDGLFGTYTTMVPYMRRWVRLYNPHYLIQGLLPSWFYGLLAKVVVRGVGRKRGVRYLNLEPALRRFAPRPLLMIHGSRDTYIAPEMGEALYARARPPKEFWLVMGARHNQAHQIAPDEYRRRVREFFDRHLVA